MPVLFLGHGSPMNAIAKNTFTNTLNNLGQSLPTPEAILIISAHWLTKGTWVTSMLTPKTIYDFYGFPQELFNVQYSAPGSPQLARTVQQLVTDPKISADDSDWGLDHGTWSVLRHLYPQAKIPVVQLSLDITQPPEFHFALGRKLRALREQGVLIIGSGNVVHNLRHIKWSIDAKPHDWAIEFDEWVKQKAEARDFQSLVSNATQSEAGRLSIPTTDHYFPLLYILGAAEEKEGLYFDVEEIQNSSISMRSLRFAAK